MSHHWIFLAHRTSVSSNTNPIFGNAPFSSAPAPPPPSSGSNTKFPAQQPPNLFPAAPFPSTSNPFSQQAFGSSQCSSSLSSRTPMFFSLSLSLCRSIKSVLHASRQSTESIHGTAKETHLENLSWFCFLEHCTATASGSAVSQSVRQTTCQLDESVSLTLIYSTLQASNSSFYLQLLSHFSEPHRTHSLLVIETNRKRSSKHITHSETALSPTRQYYSSSSRSLSLFPHPNQTREILANPLFVNIWSWWNLIIFVFFFLSSLSCSSDNIKTTFIRNQYSFSLVSPFCTFVQHSFQMVSLNITPHGRRGGVSADLLLFRFLINQK